MSIRTRVFDLIAGNQNQWFRKILAKLADYVKTNNNSILECMSTCVVCLRPLSLKGWHVLLILSSKVLSRAILVWIIHLLLLLVVPLSITLLVCHLLLVCHPKLSRSLESVPSRHRWVHRLVLRAKCSPLLLHPLVGGSVETRVA